MADDDSNYDDIDAVDEEIMTVLCANNMTNNIQYGVTSHYPSMSGRATAKSSRNGN